MSKDLSLIHISGGAEKYLWIPPSLPYYEMQGAYKNSKGFSKILVFSAWAVSYTHLDVYKRQ